MKSIQRTHAAPFIATHQQLSDVPAREDPLRHLASTTLMSVECTWFLLLSLVQPKYELPFEEYVIGLAGAVVGASMLLRLAMEPWVNGEHYVRAFGQLKLGEVIQDRIRRSTLVLVPQFIGRSSFLRPRSSIEEDRDAAMRGNFEGGSSSSDSGGAAGSNKKPRTTLRNHTLSMLLGFVILSQALFSAGIAAVTGLSK